MRILFLGDVMGRSGRTAVAEHLPRLRRDWALDFVVVNAENATGGMGLSAAHAGLLLEAGADCLTLGDHAFDQREMLAFVEQEPRVIRPLNYARAAPGHGARIFETAGKKRVYVTQVLGQIFMRRPFDDPFSAIDAALKTAPLGGAVDAVLIDVHAEATSEKMALGHWCDGRASLVVGTHTHVPTADARVLPGGTAYVTDVGMTGPRGGVIGVKREQALERFTALTNVRFETSDEDPWLNAVLVEADDEGRATSIEQLLVPLDA
jgi:metallophosphoesterase (TIGR00282 family)